MEQMDRSHGVKIAVLFIYFCVLALALANFHFGYAILPLLVLSALAWLGFELSQKPKAAELRSAAMLGLFLMVFDFIVQNAGAALGLWQVTETAFPVLYVPVEIMLLTLIGGTAWALSQPKKFSPIDSALDIALFSVFGMIGERALIMNGVMAYSGGWTSAHALAGYLATWCILHLLRYRAPGFAR